MLCGKLLFSDLSPVSKFYKLTLLYANLFPTIIYFIAFIFLTLGKLSKTVIILWATCSVPLHSYLC